MAKIQNKPSGVKQSGRQLTPPAAQQPKPENSSVSSPKEGKGWRPSVHMLYAGGVALLTWLFLHKRQPVYKRPIARRTTADIYSADNG
jgi:hypothetical protein